ncbi:MAG: hypothetical protein A3E87_01385 [Gammaproteobacteria bacterium RIFCSPHIGHO2_12_FULL_35_23]|nr:MAG: hypothetical protein A3E87_01385 [Gammaproteobacteria bacterium RIFCSPHIGHO2_12_FULL_35_23]
MNNLSCYLYAIEICTPGLLNWQQAQPILANSLPYKLTSDPIPEAKILSVKEKRRASATVNLSLHIATQLQQTMQIEANLLKPIFASSDGDSDIFNYLSTELAQPEPAISPTLFHQSLHNSAAGYWSIATRSHTPSLSISAGDYTFSNGLLTAMSEVVLTQIPTLYVAYNLISCAPLDKINPMLTWFGMGLGFSTKKMPQTLAKITLKLVAAKSETSLVNTSLEPLRKGNPIACSLPLLEQIAKRGLTDIYLDYLPPYSLKINLEEYYQ